MTNVNGAGSWEVTVRKDLPPSGCTICIKSFDGVGIDAGPVDVVCMECAEAISDALANYKASGEAVPESPHAGEAFPSSATWPPTPLTEPEAVPLPAALEKTSTKRARAGSSSRKRGVIAR